MINAAMPLTFTLRQAVLSPRTLSADVCGGKHRCYCDTAQYPFASCDAPRIKGEACSDDNGTRYAELASAPRTTNGPWGCKRILSGSLRLRLQNTLSR